MKSKQTHKKTVKWATIKKKTHRKSGFTLLEILISIGIMASLATFFLGNVGVIENLEDANEATGEYQKTQMTNLFKHYAANEGKYPDALTSTAQAICKAGATGDCVDLYDDIIASNYAKELPVLEAYENHESETGLYALTCGNNLIVTDDSSVTCGPTAIAATDTTPPVLASLLPLDNATSVAVNSNLQLTFDEPITLGAGTVAIWRTSDNSNLAMMVANGPYVSVSDATVTVNPASDLPYNTPMYVQFSNTAFADAAGNYHTGITNTTDWNFTTAAAPDVTAPTLASTSPTDNATGVATTANISFTFSEAIAAGAGNVRLYRTSDNALIWTLAASTATIVASTATFNPVIDMAASTSYYVLVDATAFADLASNAYAGIVSTTAFNFTTAAAAPVCGNLILEAGEQCDTGNPSNCSATCNNITTLCTVGYWQGGANYYGSQSDCSTAMGASCGLSVATCITLD